VVLSFAGITLSVIEIELVKNGGQGQALVATDIADKISSASDERYRDVHLHYQFPLLRQQMPSTSVHS
jgi:hypothetical protein